MATKPNLDFLNPSTSTMELMHYLGRALYVGRKSSYGRGFSFRILLLAFLTCDDALSQWFQGYVKQKGINLTEILRQEKMIEDDLGSIRSISNDEVIKQVYSGIPSASDSAGHILEQANEYAQLIDSTIKAASETSSSSPPLIDVRHIMAALQYAPNTHRDELNRYGFDREDWSNNFFATVSSRHLDEREFWSQKHITEFGTPPKPSILPELLMDFSSDTVRETARDLIGIDDDVNPLAALIAARSTQPPLAIGVFGDWGTGKTFFMKRLRKRIDDIATKARTSQNESGKVSLQKDIDFYKHIVQIDFNAWHYVEGKLWAGLVENIFSSLKGTNVKALNVQKSNEERANAKAELDNRAKQQPEALKAVEKAQQKRDETQKKLEEALAETATRPLKAGEILTLVSNDEALLNDLKEALKPLLGQSNIDASKVIDLYINIKAAQQELEKGRATLLPFLYQPKQLGLLLMILVFGTVIAIAIGIGLKTVFESDSIAQVATILSGISTLIGGVVVWLHKQTQTLNSWLNKATVGLQEFEHKAAENVRKNAEVIKLERQLQEDDAVLTTAQENYQVVQNEVENLQDRVKKLAPSNVLNEFIDSRLNSDDYRKHLGITALIRQDFEALANEIIAQNETLNADDADETREADVKVNRIVLYIDDLDRCPPNIVVDVLQAVHLLLAFDLFVVVVGVDARWVSRALRKQYPELLPSDGRKLNTKEGTLESVMHTASPHDYLEKIFQIPLWLEPIDTTGTRRMVYNLLNGQVDHGTNQASEDTAEEGKSPDVPETQELDTDSERLSDSGMLGNHTDEVEVYDELPEPPEIQLESRNLKIESFERTTMNQLATIFGRSPRAVKRFVNCYRLIKASLNEQMLDIYLKEQDYCPVMLLLSVVTGMPDLSAIFFKAIIKRNADDVAKKRLSTLTDIVNTDLKELTGTSSHYVQLSAWLSEASPTIWDSLQVQKLAMYTEKVARYSFRVDRL